MAGGLIDSLFVAIGFSVDDKELKKLDKKISETVKNVGKAFSSLGDVLDKKGLKDFGGKLDGVAESAGAMLAPILGVVGGVVKVGAAVATTTFIIDRMTMSMLKNNQAFINFQRQTGMSMGKAGNIAQAGMLSDVNMNPETALQSLKNVQSNLVGIGFGEGNLKPFQMMGIQTWGKDALQIFDDLRDKIKGLDNATASYMLNQMGISEELLPVLRMSTKEIADMRSLMLNDSQRKQLQGLSIEIQKIHMGFSLFKDKALLAILPYLIQFERAWLNISKAFAPSGKILGELLKNILVPFGKILYHLSMALAGLTYLFVKPLDLLNKMLEGIGKFISDHPKIISAIEMIGLAVLAFVNPGLAGLTALVLLLEDIAVWAMGGKSFIGTTMEIAGDKLKQLGDWLAGGFKDVGKNLGSALNNFGTFFDGLKSKWDSLPERLKYWLGGGNVGQPNTSAPSDNKISSAMAGGGAAIANLNHTQTINQDNYISFATPEAHPVARKINDLTFAAMQVDWRA